MKDNIPNDVDDPDYIEFLDNHFELMIIKEIFQYAPLTYSNGYVVGKDTNYFIEMIKSYNFDIKSTLPILISMSNVFTNTILKNMK